MKTLALSVLAALAAGSAAAQQCKNAGGLGFVGVTNDASRSVWLSKIAPGNPGDYRLEAAQGNTQVDAFAAAERGALRLSLSPFVSSGNGGVHRLFQGDCMVDTQNQKGGIVIPTLPSRPPSGIAPPIATLPPGGFAPQLPGGIRPPIGTVPPSGLMPTRPGGIGRPIATPPALARPTRPGTVAPPIATLPPRGVMPTRPGTVAPPIATLPPTGVMPTRPGTVAPPIATLPPTGVMPTRPGTVAPPIATLPPGGLLPGRPGTVQPPIGTLPPGPETPTGPGSSGGSTPSGPGPIDRAGIQAAATARTAGGNPCADRDVYVPGDPDCEEDVAPPLTTGRDLVVPTLWNFWADFQGVATEDDRYDRDGDGYGSVLTLGIDRAVSDKLVVGLQLSIEQSTNSTFGDALEQDMSGAAIGPYFAALVSPRWVIDGSLTWGQFGNEVDLLSLEGDYDQTRTLATLNATGQYEWGATIVRPRASIVYARYGDADYELSGKVGRIPIELDVETPDSEYGNVQAAVEFSRPYIVDGGILVPFVELGVGYDFLGDDEILTGDLDIETSSPLAGSARVGLRGSPTENIYIEASIGYLSAFQPDLDVMDAGLFFSYSF